MAATIKIKNSSTASAVPTSSDLVQGELAVNVTDKRLFTENASGTVVELGTNPTILTMGAAGSASAPVITRTGDTNTGIFFPAADTIAFAEGGTETMRLDSSGNLGLGVTPSAWGGGFKAFELVGGSVFSGASTNLGIMQNAYYDGTNYLYKTSSTAARYFQVGGQHIWYNAASGTAGGTITFTQAMTLDASGNLGVGTTSPSSYGQFAVVGNSTGNIYQATFANLNTGSNTTKQVSASWFLADTGGTAKRVASVLAYPDNANVLTGGMTFNVRKTDSDVSEVARIDSSGNLLVGTASLQSVEKVSIVNSAASPGGIFCKYTGAAPNSTSAEFLLFNDTSTTRMTVRSNGGIANYSANNVNLSDSRTKTNIQDAGNYLAKICAIPVRTFKYKDQTDDLLNLGCIAQEVEAVAPELVDVSGFGETPEDGVPLKAIYQTDLQYALMKALQELKAEFDAYKASHP